MDDFLGPFDRISRSCHRLQNVSILYNHLFYMVKHTCKLIFISRNIMFDNLCHFISPINKKIIHTFHNELINFNSIVNILDQPIFSQDNL